MAILDLQGLEAPAVAAHDGGARSVVSSLSVAGCITSSVSTLLCL